MPLGIPTYPQLPLLKLQITIPNELQDWLVVDPTHLKNRLLKLEIFPNFQGENKKVFETTTQLFIKEKSPHNWVV